MKKILQNRPPFTIGKRKRQCHMVLPFHCPQGLFQFAEQPGPFCCGGRGLNVRFELHALFNEQ